jgi:hypothetical protein
MQFVTQRGEYLVAALAEVDSEIGASKVLSSNVTRTKRFADFILMS